LDVGLSFGLFRERTCVFDNGSILITDHLTILMGCFSKVVFVGCCTASVEMLKDLSVSSALFLSWVYVVFFFAFRGFLI